MAEPMTIPAEHGLFYVDRFKHKPTIFVLSREQVPHVPRPERDVLIGLLRYALDMLERQQAEDAQISRAVREVSTDG